MPDMCFYVFDSKFLFSLYWSKWLWMPNMICCFVPNTNESEGFHPRFQFIVPLPIDVRPVARLVSPCSGVSCKWLRFPFPSSLSIPSAWSIVFQRGLFDRFETNRLVYGVVDSFRMLSFVMINKNSLSIPNAYDVFCYMYEHYNTVNVRSLIPG